MMGGESADTTQDASVYVPVCCYCLVMFSVSAAKSTHLQGDVPPNTSRTSIEAIGQRFFFHFVGSGAGQLGKHAQIPNLKQKSMFP